MAKDTKDAVLKVLGEPVFCTYSEKPWRVRTMLFSLSVIAIAVVSFDLCVSPDSSILGLKFTGITNELISKLLAIVIAYLLIHFLWVSVDTFVEWRLRITGTRVAPVTTGVAASESGDYPSDPQQSTLYNWWKHQARRIGAIGEFAKSLQASAAEWERAMVRLHQEVGKQHNLHAAIQGGSQLQNALAELRRRVEAVEATIASNRIPVSMGRFDAWFNFFLKSQNLRWLCIDFLAPLALAVVAIALLLRVHGSAC